MVWQYFIPLQRGEGGGGEGGTSFRLPFWTLPATVPAIRGGGGLFQIFKSAVTEVSRIRPQAYESVRVIRVFKQGLLRHHK
jgi:hypothetical protein